MPAQIISNYGDVRWTALQSDNMNLKEAQFEFKKRIDKGLGNHSVLLGCL